MIADTSFLVALFIPEDELHNKAISLLETLKTKEILILDRVLEELFTVLTYKKGIIYSLEVLTKINKNKIFSMYNIDETESHLVLELATKLHKKLSFVDYAVIYLTLKNNDLLLCFDEEMNKLTKIFKSK